MKWVLFSFLFAIHPVFSQSVLVLGNDVKLTPSDSSIQFQYVNEVPDSLSNFEAVLIFSTANSTISAIQEVAIENYIMEGGNLYLGADNWPFVEESNQLTNRFYANSFYGNFDDSLEAGMENALDLQQGKSYYAGISTVSFPMNFRLKVEAWSNDNPIILSGYIGEGKIILDGGYSRFLRPKDSQEILDELLNFLLEK